MLTRVTEEQILSNRKHDLVKEISKQIPPGSVRDIGGKIKERVSG